MTASALAQALPESLTATAAGNRRRASTARQAQPSFDPSDLAHTQDDDLRFERATEAMRQAIRQGDLAGVQRAATVAMPAESALAARASLLQLLVGAASAPMTTPDENRLYLLQRLNGAPMGLLRLRDSGLISASGGHSELARWSLNDGVMELIGRDGRCVSRFTMVGEEGGLRLFLGEAQHDASLHVLQEVRCTYSRLRMLDPELAGPFCGLYDIEEMVAATLPATPVVLLATPHTGAQRLLRLINSQPQALIDGELLHPQHIGLYGGELRAEEAGALYSLRAKDPTYFAQLLMTRSHHSDGRDLRQVPVRGFTFNPMHARSAFDWLMDTPQVRVVHLVRENLLAEYASIVAGGADSPRRPRLVFEPERFERFIDMKRRYLAMVRQRLEAREGAWAEIETTAFSKPNIQALMGFLTDRLDDVQLPSAALTRQRTERPIERFDNPEAVRQSLQRLGREDWAEREGQNS